jgi:hypothetical protein
MHLEFLGCIFQNMYLLGAYVSSIYCKGAIVLNCHRIEQSPSGITSSLSKKDALIHTVSSALDVLQFAGAELVVHHSGRGHRKIAVILVTALSRIL